MYLKKINIKFYSICFLFLLFNTNLHASNDFDYFSFINNLKSFSASFIQNTFENDGSLSSQSEGSLIYKNKSKYILDYQNPNKIKFISDGQFITTYDEDLEQAIIQSYASKFKENIIDVITDEELIKNKFSLKYYTTKEGYHIKFIPLVSDIENNVFLLLINSNKIKKISFVNDFEQSVIMEFDDFKKNIRILDSSFKIDIPDNFDVIVDK